MLPVLHTCTLLHAWELTRTSTALASLQYYEGPYGKWDSVNKLIDSIKVHLGVAEPVKEEDEAGGGSASGPESDASDQDMLDASEVATTLSRFQHEAALLGSWVDCSKLLSKCTDDWRQWGRVMLIMQVRMQARAQHKA